MTAAQPEFGVLVVDDDFMVARIHSRFLQTQAGFRVAGVAHTGIDALAKLAELTPDLMLLDVHLPDMSGLEVLRIARQDHPEVDVIVVTAERELDSVRDAWQGGAMSYLVKPFEYTALAQRLDHFRKTRAVLDTPQVDQSDIDRLFGVGTITIVSHDTTTPMLTIHGLPHPRPLFDSLKQRVIAVKRQRGVIKRDVG